MRTVLVALLLLGCGDPSHELRVDLRTDFVSGTELQHTITILYSEEREELGRDERPAASGLIDGVRIAQFGDVGSGIHRVSVELHGENGLLVERTTVVDVRESTGVTVIATRDCRDVDCDLVTTCSAGQCVDPTCSPETPELCPEPECTTNEECDPGSECASPVCLAGTCGLVASNDACDGAACDVTLGCEPPTCMAVDDRVLALAFDSELTREGDRMLQLFENASRTVSGPCGAALELGPGAGWADVPNDPELQAVWAGDFTMMAWVRSTQTPIVAVYPHVISKEQSTTPRRGANLILHGSPFALDDTVLFEARSDPELFQVRGTSVIDDEWHHVAGVRDGDMIVVFIDGEAIAQRPADASTTLDDDLPLRIGAKSRYDAEAPIPTSQLEGEIAEVRIYSRGLMPSEIQLLYDEQLAGRCACP